MKITKKNSYGINQSINVVTWRDIQCKIQTLNPSLYQAISSVPGVDDFQLLEASYPYLEPMLIKGKFRVCIDNKFQDYDALPATHEVRKVLDYAWQTTPFGFVTQNTFEVLTHTFSHTVPFGLLGAGTPYSLISTFDSQTPSNILKSAYSIISGCESILLLPAISDKKKNELIKQRLKLKETLYPKTFHDQTALLKAIFRDSHYRSNWSSKTFFFSAEFLKETKGHQTLRHTLFNTVWDATRYQRSQHLYDILWSTFNEHFILPEIGSLYKRSAFHIIAVVKHLVSIAMGSGTAFIPAVDDTTAPVSEIMDIYLDLYKLRFFYPSIMTLGKYHGTEPVYYSMQRHTFFNPELQLCNAHHTIKELETIRAILLKFQDALDRNDSKLGFDVSETSLQHQMCSTRFDFFHPKAKKESAISSDVLSLFQNDPRFTQVHRYNKFTTLPLPDTSIFFSGCVRIGTDH